MPVRVLGAWSARLPRPPGFRTGFVEEMACPMRNASVVGSCAGATMTVPLVLLTSPLRFHAAHASRSS